MQVAGSQGEDEVYPRVTDHGKKTAEARRAQRAPVVPETEFTTKWLMTLRLLAEEDRRNQAEGVMTRRTTQRFYGGGGVLTFNSPRRGGGGAGAIIFPFVLPVVSSPRGSPRLRASAVKFFYPRSRQGQPQQAPPTPLEKDNVNIAYSFTRSQAYENSTKA